MVMSYHPHKIEKSLRHGKAMCVTCLTLCLLGQVALARLHAGTIDGGEIHERGARAAGMGGVSAALPVPEAGMAWNPAMLAGSAGGGVLGWTPARFGLHELGTAAVAWAQPFGAITVAIDLRRYGAETYAEHRLGASVATHIGTRLSGGIRVSLLHIGIARYGSTLLPIIDAGAGLAVTEEIRVGVVGAVLNTPTLSGDERIPTRCAAGLSWTHAGMLVALDLEKETRHDVNLRVGTEWTLLGVLALRCGMSTISRQWTAGIGFAYGVFRIDYGLAIHSELGVTHTAGIGFAP